MSREAWSWLHLALRWTHVFAAILWIGQTNLFGWMDRVFHKQVPGLTESEDGDQIWMVHSGGFYQVRKVIVPEQISDKLHWFKWEAGTTWLTGVALLYYVYVRGGVFWNYEYASALPAEPGDLFTFGCILGMLAAALAVYTVVVNTPLGKSGPVCVLLCLAGAMGTHYAIRGTVSDRAAFLVIGAMFGTIMAGSVWTKIIPTQQNNIDRIANGEQPDQEQAAAAGLRSKHNSYLVYPVVIIMLAPMHFATLTYSATEATLILGGLIVVGFLASIAVKRMG